MLIVETGAGLEEANSYVTIAEFKAYCELRGHAEAAEMTDAEITVKLVEATEYVDTYRRFKGLAETTDQGLQFPRTSLTDWSRRPVLGIPKKLKNAVCYLAVQGLNGEAFYEVLDREVASESVGPISTSYVPGSSRHREFTAVDKLLCEYVRSAQAVPQLAFKANERPDAFRVGMHDNPEGNDMTGGE